MRKGDISITTIVAIFLGLILVFVFVYLLFFYSKQSKLNCSLCKAEFTYWCSECNTTTPNPWAQVKMSNDLKDCINDCLGISDKTSECKPKKYYCKTYIPGLVIPSD